MGDEETAGSKQKSYPKKRDFYIKSYLRKVWRWEPARKALKRKGVCESCKKKTKELDIDHINPVIDPKTGFKDWNTYYTRLFEGPLMALCRPCHKKKTAKENLERRKTKREQAK